MSVSTADPGERAGVGKASGLIIIYYTPLVASARLWKGNVGTVREEQRGKAGRR